MQSQSTQPRKDENYKIVSKGLQKKDTCIFEGSKAWTRLIFLDLKLQGLVSVKSACAQRRATLLAPVTWASLGNRSRQHTLAFAC